MWGSSRGTSQALTDDPRQGDRFGSVRREGGVSVASVTQTPAGRSSARFASLGITNRAALPDYPRQPRRKGDHNKSGRFSCVRFLACAFRQAAISA
jgi:hypothetical protein